MLRISGKMRADVEQGGRVTGSEYRQSCANVQKNVISIDELSTFLYKHPVLSCAVRDFG
jgi:hypothetical protein